MFEKLALNPVAVRCIMFLSILVALYSTYEYGRYTQRADDKDKFELQKKACEGEKDKIKLDYQLKVDAANQTARETEQKLQSDLNLIQNKAYKERKDAQTTITELRRRITAGTVILRLPSSNTGNKLRPPEGSALASAPSTKDGTELLPETADALVSLAAGCDQAVRERNELIDTYTTVMQRINALIATPVLNTEGP